MLPALECLKTAWTWLTGACKAVRSWLPLALAFLAGKREQRAEDNKKTINAVRDQNEIREDIARKPDGDAADELQRDWSRGN